MATLKTQKMEGGGRCSEGTRPLVVSAEDVAYKMTTVANTAVCSIGKLLGE